MPKLKAQLIAFRVCAAIALCDGAYLITMIAQLV